MPTETVAPEGGAQPAQATADTTTAATATDKEPKDGLGVSESVKKDTTQTAAASAAASLDIMAFWQQNSNLILAGAAGALIVYALLARK